MAGVPVKVAGRVDGFVEGQPLPISTPLAVSALDVPPTTDCRSDRGMRPDGEAEREGCNDGAASGTGCADDGPEVVCVGAVDEEHGRVEMVSIRQGMWMGGYTHV